MSSLVGNGNTSDPVFADNNDGSFPVELSVDSVI